MSFPGVAESLATQVVGIAASSHMIKEIIIYIRGAHQARSERRSCRSWVRIGDVAAGGKALSEIEADLSRFSGLVTDMGSRDDLSKIVR